MAQCWNTVPGWLTETEGNQLRLLAAGKTVLELGAWKGRSTACMAETASLIVSCDSHRGDANTGAADTLPDYWMTLSRFDIRDKVVPIIGRFDRLPGILAPESFGLVFIDGQHDVESVERDTNLAISLVAPGGVIAWHDWNYQSVREGACRAGIMAAHTIDALGWTVPIC